MSAFDIAWSLLKNDMGDDPMPHRPAVPRTPRGSVLPKYRTGNMTRNMGQNTPSIVDEFIERGFNPTYGPYGKVVDTEKSMMNRFRERYNMDMETPEEMLAYLDSLQEQEGWEQ